MIAHFWSFDTQFFGLAIDASASGALSVNGVVEQATAIKGDPHEPDADVFHTAFGLSKLRVIAALFSAVRKLEQTAVETPEL